MADETPATPKRSRNGKKISLVTKLTEVQASISGVDKTGFNDFQQYTYAEESAIVSACRDELAKRHVMIIPSIDSVVHDGSLTTIQTSYRICDGDSGEEIITKWAGTGSDKGDKGLYKATTGSQKYLLLKLFLIPTGDQGVADDPEHPSREVRPAKPVTKTAAPRTAPAKDTPKVPPGSISHKQLGRLHAIAGSVNADKDQIAGYCKDTYGFDSLDSIHWQKYDEIIKMIEGGIFNQPKPEPKPKELTDADIPF